MFDTLAGRCPSPLQNAGVFAAMDKLSKLVEHHPKLHSKLERMLEEVFHELESEVSATERKQKIYLVANQKLILMLELTMLSFYQ